MAITVKYKAAHAISLGVIGFIFSLTFFLVPKLFFDESTTVSTVGSFLTLYGVIFAIIELLRVKGASEIAREEARRTYTVITNLVNVKAVTECQVIISNALAALDEGVVIPSSTIGNIIRIYSEVFHAQIGDKSSEHRQNRSMLHSYSFTSDRKSKSSPKTRKALLSIAGHLGQFQGDTKNKREHLR